MRIALIAAALLAVASPVFAQAGSSAPVAKTKKGGTDDPNRVVCKREHVVGSNRPQKVCMTVAERQRLKDQADRISDPGNRKVDEGAAVSGFGG